MTKQDIIEKLNTKFDIKGCWVKPFAHYVSYHCFTNSGGKSQEEILSQVEKLGMRNPTVEVSKNSIFKHNTNTVIRVNETK